MKRVVIFFFLLSSIHCQANWDAEILSETPRIVVIHDFLSFQECDYLINLARPALQRSTVVNESSVGSGQVDPRRTSRGTFLTQVHRDQIVQSIEKRLSQLTNFPRENGESIQMLFYEKGAEYQPHYDFFNPATPGGALHLKRGGQRIATVIMYLNTPSEGGETIFPVAKISVVPKKGKALFFYNCTPSGETDPAALHGGAPVICGEKWIATKWFRMAKFE
ncbi:MAG: 2OG-Fe(II) oxygenase [Chlamydiota bacterium]